MIAVVAIPGLRVWYSICVYRLKNLQLLLLQKNFCIPTVKRRKRYETKLSEKII